MGAFEDIAASDLRLRLVVGPAMMLFGVFVFVASAVTESPHGIAAGVVLGAAAALGLGYAIATRL